MFQGLLIFLTSVKLCISLLFLSACGGDITESSNGGANSSDSKTDLLSGFGDIQTTPIGPDQENREVVAATTVNLGDAGASLIEAQQLYLANQTPFEIGGLLGIIEGSEDLGCIDISFDDENQINKNAWLMLGTTGIFRANPQISESIPIKMDLDNQTIDPGMENAYTLKEFSQDEEKTYASELCFYFDPEKMDELLSGLALQQGLDGIVVLQYLTEKDGSPEIVQIKEKKANNEEAEDAEDADKMKNKNKKNNDKKTDEKNSNEDKADKAKNKGKKKDKATKDDKKAKLDDKENKKDNKENKNNKKEKVNKGKNK